MELAVRWWRRLRWSLMALRLGRDVVHLDGFWPPVVVLGAAREPGTVSTVPGRISDGSAPMASALAWYRAGQLRAIRAAPAPEGSREAVIDHRLSPGSTV